MRWPRSVISSFAFRRYYYFVTTTYPHALATQRHFLLNLSSLILLCHYNLPSCVGHAASFPPLPFVVIITLSLQPTLMRWPCSVIPSFAFRRYFYSVTTTYPHALVMQHHSLLCPYLF